MTGFCIGFTGTRKGMTEQQKEAFHKVFNDRFRHADSVRHGCARGADTEFAIMISIRSDKVRTVIGHPCNIKSEQDTTSILWCHELQPECPPLERNNDIVRLCHVLIATPAESVEQRRGGTWYTIRQARKMNRHMIVIFPDGTTEEFNQPK